MWLMQPLNPVVKDCGTTGGRFFDNCTCILVEAGLTTPEWEPWGFFHVSAP